MMDEHIDETFQALQAELTLTPSPEFAAKVRARVAEAPPRGWFGGWRLAAASALVLAGAVVAVVVSRSGMATSAVAPLPAVARVESVGPAVIEPPAGAFGAAEQPRAARPWTNATRTAARLEPEVLVPPDQRLALTRLLLAIKDGRAVVPAAENAFDEMTGELKPLAAIAPLVVEPLSTAATGGGNGRRER